MRIGVSTVELISLRLLAAPAATPDDDEASNAARLSKQTLTNSDICYYDLYPEQPNSQWI